MSSQPCMREARLLVALRQLPYLTRIPAQANFRSPVAWLHAVRCSCLEGLSNGVEELEEVQQNNDIVIEKRAIKVQNISVTSKYRTFL